MDLMETESFCSNSSSDIISNTPKDYSCTGSSEAIMKSEQLESNNNKSVKLNFGVDRLLSKCDTKVDLILEESLMNRKLIDKNMIIYSANNNNNNNSNNNNNVDNNIGIHGLFNNNNFHSLNLNDGGSHQLGINLLQHQFPQFSMGSNQNFILKPLPIRYGRTHNVLAHHQQQQQQQQQYFQSNLRKMTMPTNTSNGAMHPYNNMAAFHNIMRLPSMSQLSPNHSSTQFFNNQRAAKNSSHESKGTSGMSQNTNNNANGNHVKRKRSWSRAVFSNLQRKGLERQFEFQKYITKPDRKKLAARLGLKDAQVKVWFQNRRMKWRHTTRGSAIPSKSANSNDVIAEDELEQFTSSSSDNEDADIDVVTDN